MAQSSRVKHKQHKYSKRILNQKNKETKNANKAQVNVVSKRIKNQENKKNKKPIEYYSSTSEYNNKNKNLPADLKQRGPNFMQYDIGSANETHKFNYFHHTIRIPLIGTSLSLVGDSKNVTYSKESLIKTASIKNDFSLSYSLSYLYSLTKDLRFGVEARQMNYSGESNLNLGNTTSFLLRSEFVMYKSPSLEVYGMWGAGLSINSINLSYIYSYFTSSSDNSFTEYKTIPVFNGVQLPSDSPYSYCRQVLDINHLNYDTVKEKTDDNGNVTQKGSTTFYGNGSGICIVTVSSDDDKDKSKNYSIEYDTKYVPVNAVSIPWFIGVGADYSLTHIYHKLFYFNSLDAQIDTTKKDIGVSVFARYFNNGIARVEHTEPGRPTDHFTLKYKGYVNVGVSLYVKL